MAVKRTGPGLSAADVIFAQGRLVVQAPSILVDRADPGDDQDAEVTATAWRDGESFKKMSHRKSSRTRTPKVPATEVDAPIDFDCKNSPIVPKTMVKLLGDERD